MTSERDLRKRLRELDHALRTPLGVALGVVSDGAKGIPLERQDFIDAEASLRQIHLLLEEALRSSE